MVYPGGDQPGDIVIGRPQLPQVAPLRHGAVWRAAVVCRGVPDDRILDVWPVTLRTVKQALLI